MIKNSNHILILLFVSSLVFSLAQNFLFLEKTEITYKLELEENNLLLNTEGADLSNDDVLDEDGEYLVSPMLNYSLSQQLDCEQYSQLVHKTYPYVFIDKYTPPPKI